MKTIGLLGGMSWESTLVYYRLINEGVRAQLGGLHSAKINLCSVDFAEIEALQRAEHWAALAEILGRQAEKLESAGADFLVICTNTMHKVAPAVARHIRIPLLHIADAAAACIRQQGITTVGLLGTRFTMEQEFYKGRLERQHRLRVLVPSRRDRELVNRVIYQELCTGRILDRSRHAFLRIIRRMAEQGATGVILGCTEINQLLQQQHTPTRLFDTTIIHARQAVETALAGEAG